MGFRTDRATDGAHRTYTTRPRGWPRALLSGAAAVALAASTSVMALAQTPPPPGPLAVPPGQPPAPPVPTFQGRDDGDAAPAPGSIGTDISVIYNGAAPSQVQKELIGPYQLLRSGQLDVNSTPAVITIPLYQGKLRGQGQNIWYILTDTDDERNAEQLGINFAAKLAYANTGRAARVGTLEKDGNLIFDGGTVDFRPERRIVPGDAPNFFPPRTAEPGSRGDASYSPLVRITNSASHVYNAPMVAYDVNADVLNRFCDGNPDYTVVHDRVAKICPREGTVTIKLTPIFTFARPALYMSTEASDPMVAALDAGTFAPAMADLGVGRDDGFASAVERLFVMANGPTGRENPQRQGLNSVLGDGPMANGADRAPLNVIGGIPTITLDYSPLWDLNLGEWTADAIARGYRSRVTEEFQILGLVQQGWITGPGGMRFGSTGIVVNCPIVHRFL